MNSIYFLSRNYGYLAIVTLIAFGRAFLQLMHSDWLFLPFLARILGLPSTSELMNQWNVANRRAFKYFTFRNYKKELHSFSKAEDGSNPDIS